MTKVVRNCDKAENVNVNVNANAKEIWKRQPVITQTSSQTCNTMSDGDENENENKTKIKNKNVSKNEGMYKCQNGIWSE